MPETAEPHGFFSFPVIEVAVSGSGRILPDAVREGRTFPDLHGKAMR